MQGNRNNRGAKRRFPVLMYSMCVLFSVATTIIAPPQRGFSQGQPEMQQSMDNMVSHGVLLKKTGPKFPESGAIDYPAMLTSKTSSLLDEAKNALRTMPNSKEKQWVDAFVQRMTAIELMLEQTVQRRNPNFPKNLNSVSVTPVPEGLPSQWPAPSAVRGSNPFQKTNKIMSKLSVTSPELSKVLPESENPFEHQGVTKPATMANKPETVEDDELVRELESLHQEVAVDFPSQSSNVIISTFSTPEFTAPATIDYSENADAVKNMQMERKKFNEKALKEISMSKHMDGDIPNEIIDALNKENNRKTSLAITPKTEPRKDEKKNGGMVGSFGNEKINDVNKEEKRISNTVSANSVAAQKITNQNDEQLEIKGNYTLQNVQLPHLAPFPKLGYHGPFMPYQRGFGYLKRPNPFNFYGYRYGQQQSYVPDALKQRMMRPQGRMYNDQLAPHYYNGYMARNRYHPSGLYGYAPHWGRNNSSPNFPSPMLNNQIKPMVNQQTEYQLSDEMKRQLRDGKIVVLSDSVVRSNFNTSKEETTAGKDGAI